MTVYVETTTGQELGTQIRLLEGFLREGTPLPETFVSQLRKTVEAGDTEVLTAFDGHDGHEAGREAVGAAVLSYRLSISAGGYFASVEELYVSPGARRSGVGKALLEEAGRRCRERGISYVEAQAVDEAAETFYTAVGFGREEGVQVMSRSYAL